MFIMKTKTLAISLFVIGVVMMIYIGFNYVTTKKVIDSDPLNMSSEKNYPNQWPFAVGSILLIGSIEIALIVREKNATIL